MTHNYDLVEVLTSDDLKLRGLLKQGDKNKTAYIFVHGFTTDFYSGDFCHAFAEKLSNQGNTVLLAQNRGTGCHTEFIRKDGSGVFIGSYYEKLEEAHLDISAFVEYFVKEGFGKIALIGHSLGTIKAVRYLFEGQYKDKISHLILLAPFDKNAYLEHRELGSTKRFLAVAEQMVNQGKAKDIVPVPEYEDYPITWETYVSWYNQSDLSCMWDFHRQDYDFPVMNKINIPVKVILGELDEFVNYPEFGVSAQFALETMKKHIKNCDTSLIKGSGHTYLGFEEIVAEEIAKFAQDNT